MGRPRPPPRVRPQSTGPCHKHPKDRSDIPGPASPSIIGGAAAAHNETPRRTLSRLAGG